MYSTPSPVVIFTVIAALAGLATVTMGIRVKTSPPSWGVIVAVTLPGLLMLALFYSLAINMYRTLDGWPASIGNRGFPDQLLLHVDLAGVGFAFVLFSSIILWPIAFLVCALVKHWRIGLLYLGVYALSIVVCAVGILVAPSGFTNWWWD